MVWLENNVMRTSQCAMAMYCSKYWNEYLNSCISISRSTYTKCLLWTLYWNFCNDSLGLSLDQIMLTFYHQGTNKCTTCVCMFVFLDYIKVVLTFLEQKQAGNTESRLSKPSLNSLWKSHCRNTNPNTRAMHTNKN